MLTKIWNNKIKVKRFGPSGLFDPVWRGISGWINTKPTDTNGVRK
jgi:hypothetical protein